MSSLLSDADLSGAHLWATNFHGALVDGVNFEGAVMEDTIFGDNNLSDCKNLDKVDHVGPSVIAVSSLFSSRGQIPENFLRGVGVPDDFIAYIPSLIGAAEGIQFYSCFISHSSKDSEFTRRLHSRMQEAHLRVWYAPEDMRGGRKTYTQIEQAIRIYDKLLIVLSENSLTSEWVVTELREALETERATGRRKLFPVRLVDMETIRSWKCMDSDTGRDLAVEVRTYHIPDFSDWKAGDSFEGGFKRLLQDLRSE
jgi:hypothetical protein